MKDIPETKSIKHLHQILDQSPIGLAFFKGEELILDYANNQFLKVGGLDQNQIGQCFDLIASELIKQEFLSLLRKIFTSKESSRVVKKIYYYTNPDYLSENYFDIIFTTVLDENTFNVIGVNVSVTEIADREFYRQMILDSTSEFDDVISNSPCATIILSGEDPVIEIMNNKMMRTLGKKLDVLGKRFVDVIPQEMNQQFIKLYQEVYRSGKLHSESEFRIEYYIKEQLIVSYLNLSFKPKKDRNGKVYAVVIISVNVTDLIIAREQLEENERRFITLADFMPQFIWIADKNGIVTYFNKKWFNYFGLPENSDPNNTFWDLLHPDYHDKVFDFWHDCVANNKAYEIEYQLRVSENPAEYKWFLARGTPVYNSDNEIEIWIGTSTDIDDFKLLQKQKDDFLGIASHELKTPLTSLKLYSQFIEMNLKKQGDLKNADLAHKMEAQINKLNNLITDLLDVTKIQNGKMLLQEQEFELVDLVLEITEEQQMSTNHKIALEIEFSGKVFGDRDRIGQVLTNLMSNAIKYSPDDDRVLIKVFQADKNVKVVVQDFGIGIPADKIDKVFDQYMRVESKYEKTISGLGLGLYISSEIIKRSHGKIYVTSEEEKGSNFCFELPITTTNL